MNNYLPLIFGITFLLGGIYLFLFSFRIYKPKHKNENGKFIYEKKLKKYGTIMKICSVGIIIGGLYDILNLDSNRYVINVSEKKQWQTEDRKFFIEKCIDENREISTQYPKIAQEYCECYTDKVIMLISKDEYYNNSKQTAKQKEAKILSLGKECLEKLATKIDSIKNN